MNFDFVNLWDSIKPWILDNGLKIILILVIAYIFHAIAQRAITKAVRKLVVAKKGVSKEAEEKREDTLIRILHGTLHVVVIIVTAMIVLSELGVNIGPLIAGAGVLGLAVGFGGQYLVKDIVTGLFIILENQYRVGDSVEISGVSGSVEDISLRVTTLRDLDGIVHYVPNGQIGNVSNKSMSFSRVNLDIGVGYGADLNKSRDVINRVGKELAEDEDWKNDIIKAPEFLRVNELGDSAVILKIVGETKPARQFAVAGELRKRIKEAFDEEGIEIPFPQMVIHQAK